METISPLHSIGAVRSGRSPRVRYGLILDSSSMLHEAQAFDVDDVGNAEITLKF
jgi:hypothetical protein